VLTNPPFGSNVGNDQRVGGSDETRAPNDKDYRTACEERYGNLWTDSHERMLQAASAHTPILELFEIGRDKANRPTEVLFIERCLSLLRSGGRMGIVLPDGNLNNPSLGWLRRWCEGKARLVAVVSLPEETFRSSAATVKASLVFLRRFTTEEDIAWERAWSDAHDKIDPIFNAERDTLCTDYSPRIQTGDSSKVSGILAKLSSLGVFRTAVSWEAGEPPPYPRSVGTSRIRITRTGWEGTPTHTGKAVKLRKDYAAAMDAKAKAQAIVLQREVLGKLREIDESHSAALWSAVRKAMDYPVFVAAPKTVGITSTGDTGEGIANELPEVLKAYQSFASWVLAGAVPESEPCLSLVCAA
jgi:type I restriction enzyme M protein